MTRQQLALGTAQFGLDYGITNAAGRVPPSQVTALLRTAWDGGVRMLDTAQAYGDSERVLGECLQDDWQLVTKTLPLRCTRIGDAEMQAVDDAFNDSLRLLRVDNVDTLLVHHAQDLLVPGGETLHAWLLECKRRKSARRIGASVYDGAEIGAVLERFDLEVVQLPANIADQRLVADGSVARLRERGVEIHVRSLFLQGVLLAPVEFAAKRFPDQADWAASFHAECARRGITPQQACLSFFRSCAEFTTAVIGVSNAAELAQLLAAWDNAPAMDWSGWAVDNNRFTDPRLWNT